MIIQTQIGITGSDKLPPAGSRKHSLRDVGLPADHAVGADGSMIFLKTFRTEKTYPVGLSHLIHNMAIARWGFHF